MKFFAFVPVFFVFAAACIAAPLTPEQVSESQKIRDHLIARNGSFLRVILSSAGEGTMRELSGQRSGCGDAVRQVYKSGQTFYSPLVAAAATKLGDFRKGSGLQDDIYFHLSKSEDFADNFAVGDSMIRELNGPGEEPFIFVRTRTVQRAAYHSNWGRVFYITENTESLMQWYEGFYGVKFTINPNAKLVSLKSSLFEPALSELAKRFPEVGSACGTKFDASIGDSFGTVNFHALVFLIAEDSGIDAIDYLQGNHWFQLLSPDALLKSEYIGRVGREGRGWEATTTAKNPPLKMDYLSDPVISVVSATYGKNLMGGAAEGNATRAASAFLDGRIFADYKISSQFLAAAGVGLTGEKDFTLVYECLPGGLSNGAIEPITITVPAAEAEGKILKLNCAKLN